MNWSACVLALLACAGASAATPGDYAWLFPLETATRDASAWRIDLTPEVYARVHDAGLRDIAVFNAAGQPVPFAPMAMRATPTTHTRDIPLPLLALPADARAAAADLRVVIERDAEGRLRRIDAGEHAPAADTPATRQWLVDAAAIGCAVDRLTLDWDAPSTGLVARFDVEAGEDLQGWRRVGGGSVLVLEQGGARLERHDIALDGARHAWLRLQRSDDGAAIEGLRASARCVEHDAGRPARSWLDATPVEAGEGGTRHDYSLPAALPVDGARIVLGNDNALADITLSAFDPRDRARSTPLARQTAFRLRAGADTLRNGDLEFAAAVRRDAFRLDAATPLASMPRLSLAWLPDRFVFLAEGDGPYVLAVGSARARRPDYPLDAALASLRASLGKDWQPPPATIGTGREGAGAQALEPPPRPLPWGTWLLWTLLVAGAVLVGAFALVLLRRNPSATARDSED